MQENKTFLQNFIATIITNYHRITIIIIPSLPPPPPPVSDYTSPEFRRIDSSISLDLYYFIQIQKKSTILEFDYITGAIISTSGSRVYLNGWLEILTVALKLPGETPITKFAIKITISNTQAHTHTNKSTYSHFYTLHKFTWLSHIVS